MNWIKAIMLILVLVVFTGCVTHTRVETVNGKAYVVDGHIFGTDMLFCDGHGGTPECWPVNEVEAKGGK